MKRLLVLAFVLVTVPVLSQPATRANAPDHCRWETAQLNLSHKERLACQTAQDKWQYVHVSSDFDVHTLKKAQAGDPRAMVLLGYFYGLQAPHELRNKRRARYWLRKAADKGDAQAMLVMAMLIDRGDIPGRAQDEAARWYESAAKGGKDIAMFMIAIRYERGIAGVQKDEAKAAFWYHQCADKGDDECMVALSRLYRDGRGVPKDSIESKRWWQRYQDSFEKRIKLLDAASEHGRASE